MRWLQPTGQGEKPYAYVTKITSDSPCPCPASHPTEEKICYLEYWRKTGSKSPKRKPQFQVQSPTFDPQFPTHTHTNITNIQLFIRKTVQSITFKASSPSSAIPHLFTKTSKCSSLSQNCPTILFFSVLSWPVL